MKIPFLPESYSCNESIRTSQWPWPAYCHQPKTLSFRTGHDKMFKTNNTVYNMDEDTHDDSNYFTNSSGSASFSTESDESRAIINNDSVETVIRGLKSETTDQRLFFESVETSSILEEAKTTSGYRRILKESTVLAMESNDPFVDFKKSMEEMVEAYGLRESWEGLEELLCCYLRVNSKSNHGYIIGAFVDLIVALAFSSPNNNSSKQLLHDHQQRQQSPSSPLSLYMTSSSDESCSSTNCVSLFEI